VSGSASGLSNTELGDEKFFSKVNRFLIDRDLQGFLFSPLKLFKERTNGGGRAAAALAHSCVQFRRGPSAGGVVLWEAVQRILAAGLPSTSALLPAARRQACFGSAACLCLWWLGTGLVEVTWDDGGVGASRGEVVGGEGSAVGRRRRRLSCCSAVAGLHGPVLGPAGQRA
jgi:hypothetical protein